VPPSMSRCSVITAGLPTARATRWRASMVELPSPRSIRETIIRPSPARSPTSRCVRRRCSRAERNSAPRRANCSRLRRSASIASALRLTLGMIAS
jgi:hypothetical protein